MSETTIQTLVTLVESCKCTVPSSEDAFRMLYTGDQPAEIVRLPDICLADMSKHAGDVLVPYNDIDCKQTHYYPAFTVPANALMLPNALARPVSPEFCTTKVRNYMVRDSSIRRELARLQLESKFAQDNFNYICCFQ